MLWAGCSRWSPTKSAIRIWFDFSEWDNIPEELPDEIDLAMLAEIEKDPDCHEFVSSADAMKLLGL